MTSTTFPTHLSCSSFCLSHRTKRLFLLLFQLVPRSYQVRPTNCAALLLTFAGGTFAPVPTEQCPVSSSGRQLRSLIESYGYASLRYAAAGGMRSFIQPPPLPFSLSLSPSLFLPLSFCAPESREKAWCGESKRFRSNSVHL